MAVILTKKKDTTGAPGAGDLTNAAGGAELAVSSLLLVLKLLLVSMILIITKYLRLQRLDQQ